MPTKNNPPSSAEARESLLTPAHSVEDAVARLRFKVETDSYRHGYNEGLDALAAHVNDILARGSKRATPPPEPPDCGGPIGINVAPAVSSPQPTLEQAIVDDLAMRAAEEILGLSIEYNKGHRLSILIEIISKYLITANKKETEQ